MSQPAKKEVLVAAMPDVRPLATILRGVSFTDAPRCTAAISEAGLMITVEYKKVLLASAYLYAQMFSEYTFNKPVPAEGDDDDDLPPTIEIKLSLLLSALDVFGGAGMGTSTVPDKDKSKNNRSRGDDWDADRLEVDDKKKATAMRLTWLGKGHRLSVHLTDAPNVSTVCELSISNPEPIIDMPFDSDEVEVKIIMKSSWLRDALSEIDPKSEKITFVCTPPEAQVSKRGKKRKPTFRLKASGTWGDTTMDYPDDKEVLEVADFRSDKPTTFTYRFDHIYKSMHALRNSMKTSLRIDGEGILSLQFMIPFRRPRGTRDNAPGPSENFIEFRCASLFEDA